MNKTTCYKVGYIAKVHGLKGEITVVITEMIDVSALKSFFIDVNNNLVPYFIQEISDRGDKAFVKLEDINSVAQAETLKGCSLYLPKEMRPKLNRGEFYDDEIVGFQVVTETDEPLGTINEVVPSGPNRLLSINYLGKEVLIPTNGPFIKSVNKTKKKIVVQLPHGFFDI